MDEDDHIPIWPVVLGLVGTALVIGGMAFFVILSANT